MKKIIVFIHIERAGGTSLHHLLNNNFPNYIILNPRRLYTNKEKAFFGVDNLKLLLDKYAQLDGFGGHTTRSFLGYEKLSKFPIFYLTFLRDPVQRYLSHFNYQKNVMNINWKLEDFLATQYFNNFQCKRIINKEDPQEAFKELKKYSFLGLTECYDESLLLLKQRIDWARFNPLYEKKNKIPPSKKNIRFDELPVRLQDSIMRNNRLDQELYDLARNHIYTKQKKEFKGDLAKELESFRKNLNGFKYSMIKKNFIRCKKIIFRYLIEPKLFPQK